jgi:uncharacterized protein (TIGR03437 family)
MDTPTLRTRRKTSGHYASYLFSAVVALAASQSLEAANLLQTYASNGTTVITSVSLSCNTATGPGPSATIVVKPLAALVSPNQIIVSATPLSGSGTANTLNGAGAANVVITPPANQTLTSTNTSLTYTISLAATPSVGCNGLINAAPTFFFNHISGTTTNPGTTVVGDVGSTVNTSITQTTSGLSTPATVNITCIKSGSNYIPGPAQTISVGSTATGGNVFALDTSGSNAPASWVTLNPASPSGTATSGTPATFTVQAAAGCNALPITAGNNTSTTTINLASTGTTAPDKAISVTLTVSGPSASSLVVSPSPITITCAKNGSTYTPNYPQTVSVTSTATGGTPFTVDTTTNAPAAWLVFSSTAGGNATTNPVSFTLQAAAGCGGFASGSSTVTTVHLLNSPFLDKVFAVTLQIVPPTIISATPSPATFTYVKGSGTAGFVDVRIAPTTSTIPFFTVNTATLPIWVRLDAASGVAPQSLRFSSTTVADTLAPGTYSASVVISVAGYGDLILPVTMLLTNKASQLTIVGPTTVPINWTIGQGLPTPTITAISTDTPIAYTATTGGTLGPIIPAAQVSGLAYSFGTPINVTFNPQAFAAAQPGNVLTGTVTLTWGSPVSTIVVTFQITVLTPGATITSLSPASLPVQSAGFVYTVALTGTGFVPSSDPTQKTQVGLVLSGNALTIDTNIQANIVNQSNITLQITVPSGSDPIPFAGGAVNIGVCNPIGGVCTAATGQATLVFGTNPIIQAVTSSSSLLQGSTVSVAPYDMISIFGSNFCPNCTSTQVLTSSPNTTTLTYPTSLAFDSTHSLSVTFQTHSGGTFIANAPILFATNSQINLLVPSAVTIGVTTDIVVNYGSGAFGSSTLKSSSLTLPSANACSCTVNIVATDPGIFTIGADGQGNGAALDASYNLISATNPAGTRTGSSNSDIISIYMTGLGAPDSAANNANAATDNSGNGLLWSADCVSTATYLPSFNAAQTGLPLNTLDGTLIIPSVLNTGRLVPCITSGGTDAPTVTVGGQSATVKYAGWVPGTVAGLYQINIQLPANTPNAFTTASGLTGQSILSPTQLPVVVTSNSVSSQTGVSLWVAPRLLVSGPSSGGSANTVAATVGVALPSSNNSVTATQGTGSITYAVTSGLLPSGLAISPTTGLISGTPAANTAGSYTVTVTATDSANIPVTGTNTFVVTVAGGLFMSNTTPSVSTFGLANSSVSTVTASGGVFPYAYSIAIPSQTLPAGLSINPATGVISTTTATPAGSYTVVVSAHDSTGTPLTGTSTFTIVVNLNVTNSAPASISGGSAGNYTTVSATGNTGTVTYATAAALPSWASLDSTTGVLSVTSSSVTGTTSVTVIATDGTAPADASAAGIGSVTFNLTIQ